MPTLRIHHYTSSLLTVVSDSKSLFILPYLKSDSHDHSLQRTYARHNKELGQTGVGIDPESIIPCSEIANKIGVLECLPVSGLEVLILIDQIEEIRADFPWWDDLNPMWREMPK
jgi:hypothetical protein